MQFSALSRELCLTLLSTPSLVTPLGDFFASYCISLYLSQRSSSSPENGAITQSTWKWEREEGRQRSAFQQTTSCTLPQINNQTEQVFCLETAPSHTYSTGNVEPNRTRPPLRQPQGGITCDLLNSEPSCHYLTHQKEYSAEVKRVSIAKQDADVPPLNPRPAQAHVTWYEALGMPDWDRMDLLAAFAPWRGQETPKTFLMSLSSLGRKQLFESTPH